MWSQVLAVTDATMGVNYGLNKVRFPAPVPVGSKLRLTATLADVEEIKGGVQLTVAARHRARGRRQAGLHRRAGLPLLRLTVPLFRPEAPSAAPPAGRHPDPAGPPKATISPST